MSGLEKTRAALDQHRYLTAEAIAELERAGAVIEALRIYVGCRSDGDWTRVREALAAFDKEQP